MSITSCKINSQKHNRYSKGCMHLKCAWVLPNCLPKRSPFSYCHVHGNFFPHILNRHQIIFHFFKFDKGEAYYGTNVSPSITSAVEFFPRLVARCFFVCKYVNTFLTFSLSGSLYVSLTLSFSMLCHLVFYFILLQLASSSLQSLI